MTYPNLQTPSTKNLKFIGDHKNAFEINPVYPLCLFDDFVTKIEPCNIECSCKIEDNKLHPARFNLFIDKNIYRSEKEILNFFHQVETRVGVTLDYKPLNQFMTGLNYERVNQIVAGIDARPDWIQTRIKNWWVIQDYPEKIETAISLGNTDCPELRNLLEINSSLLIGFHFHLHGQTNVRLYPNVNREHFQQIAIQAQLAKILSTPALKLLEDCAAVSLVLTENGDKILHYHVLPDRVNFFVDNLHHDLATRAHAPYRHQSKSFKMTVSLSDNELLAGSIETMNFYYMN